MYAAPQCEVREPSCYFPKPQARAGQLAEVAPRVVTLQLEGVVLRRSLGDPEAAHSLALSAWELVCHASLTGALQVSRHLRLSASGRRVPVLTPYRARNGHDHRAA